MMDCIYVRTYTNLLVRTYIHMYVHTYIHMYVHTYIRMYVCAHSPFSLLVTSTSVVTELQSGRLRDFMDWAVIKLYVGNYSNVQ